MDQGCTTSAPPSGGPPPSGEAPPPGAPAPLDRPRGRVRALLLQLAVFAGVGGVFNVFYALLYVVLRGAFDAQPANALALVISTVAGTWGHRRVTFGVRGWAGAVSHQVLGLALLAFSLVVTAGSLAVLAATVQDPSRQTEVLVLAAANVGVGLVRFGAFRVAMVPERPPGQRNGVGT